MKQRKAVSSIILFFFLFSVLLVSYHLTGDHPAITYFPENEPIVFKDYGTTLQLTDGGTSFDWFIHSSLYQTAYLMQNFSLLYKNNRLIEINNQWKKDTNRIADRRSVHANFGYYQSVTVHQAEVHRGETISGKEVSSYAQLFVASLNGRRAGFQQGRTEAEKQIERKIVTTYNRQQKELLMRAAKQYGFQPEAYKIISLADLASTAPKILFPSRPDTASRITGQLWEGIYKIILSGFQMGENQYEPVIGSSLPLLLIGKDHMLVLTESAGGRIVLLKQLF